MENFFNGVLAETWSWTNTIVGGDYVLIFCFWCKIASNKSAHTITIPTSTNFDFYIDCFISPVYTISVIMLFLNQYEYLSNFYYLTCFKPIDTSLRYLFHKNEKKIDEIAGYYFKPIDIDIYFTQMEKYQVKLLVIDTFSQNF